eukprot:2373262-Prymnesium_polylepis.1
MPRSPFFDVTFLQHHLHGKFSFFGFSRPQEPSAARRRRSRWTYLPSTSTRTRDSTRQSV